MRQILWILLFILLPSLPALAQWQRQDSGTDASLRGLCAVSEQVAWASGTKGTVLRTVDGGKHWENVRVPGAEALDFRDIQAFDGREAFVLSSGPGAQSRIYKTTDGGKHWMLQFTNSEAKAFYDGFAFWDRKHGIALSDPIDGKFLLLTTEDGQTWKPLTPQTLPAALPDEGGFAASGTCLCVQGKRNVWFATGGAAARVFHSADRGLHWEAISSPLLSGSAPQGIFSIAFLNERRGIIVGGDYQAPKAGEKNAAYTEDGGKTWTLSRRSPLGYRSAVVFLPAAPSPLWITVGTSGSDYTLDSGKTWVPLDRENYNAVSSCRKGAVWAVGPQGRIALLNGIDAPLSQAKPTNAPSK